MNGFVIHNQSYRFGQVFHGMFPPPAARPAMSGKIKGNNPELSGQTGGKFIPDFSTFKVPM